METEAAAPQPVTIAQIVANPDGNYAISSVAMDRRQLVNILLSLAVGIVNSLPPAAPIASESDPNYGAKEREPAAVNIPQVYATDENTRTA